MTDRLKIGQRIRLYTHSNYTYAGRILDKDNLFLIINDTKTNKDHVIALTNIKEIIIEEQP